MDKKQAAARIAEEVLKHCDEVSKLPHAINRSLRRGNDDWEAHLRDLDHEMHRNWSAYMLDYNDNNDAEDAGAAEAEADA